MKGLLQQALELIEAQQEWIMAVPYGTPLPTMPGIDRDWGDAIEASIRAEIAKPELKPYQGHTREQCPTCGEDEPYTVSCGTSDSDTKALCKRTNPPPSTDHTEVMLGMVAQPESEPGCRVCGSPIGSLHMAAGNLKCGWPARVQASDCEPEGTQTVSTPASDREALVAQLRELVLSLFSCDAEFVNKAADMLEADAQLQKLYEQREEEAHQLSEQIIKLRHDAQQVAVPIDWDRVEAAENRIIK